MARRRDPQADLQTRRDNSMAARRDRGDGWVVGLLQLLGLGIFGFLALMLSRSYSSPKRPRRALRLDDDEHLGLWQDAADGELSFDPDPGDSISWIAGPSGDLRILERHPEGEIHLLLIHGLGGRLEHWLPLMSRTGPAMHSIAMDLPGHGESDCLDDDGPTVASLAQAARAVIETLGLRRVIVVGHDLGATVALQLAATAPQRVGALFLVDPNGDQSRLAAQAKEQVLAAMEKDPHEEVRWQFRQILIDAPPQVADRVLEDVEACRATALLGAVRSSLDFDPVAALAAYDGPCQALVSDLNNLPYSLHKVSPDLPWALLPEASHWLMLDAPQGVWENLVDFLDRRLMSDD